MSRNSLLKRLETIEAKVAEVDPLAVAVHRLKPAQRMQFDKHQAKLDARAARYPEPGSLYEALANDELGDITMPYGLSEALGIEVEIDLTGSLEQLADRYRSLAEDAL